MLVNADELMGKFVASFGCVTVLAEAMVTLVVCRYKLERVSVGSLMTTV